eukprot:73056_1
MSTSSSTNMDPPRPKKPTKRKNQLRISQPIHHQQNINPNYTNDDSLHVPQRKKPRLSSPSNSNKHPPHAIHSVDSSNNHNHSNTNNRMKANRKPTHVYSAHLPIETQQDLLASYRHETVINFSCIG